MRQSQLFTKTIKQAPKDEKSINAQLLIRGGFIDKLGAGIYNFLPLGWRVHQKIENIIREEMNAIGGQELYLAALHPREYWEKTKRWSIPEIFKLKSQTGKEYALSWTHEEIITPLAKKFIHSYKDLPKYVYQIQVKMRDELRAKSGLFRSREFIMKDLYSFHAAPEDLDDYYGKVIDAYFKIFDRCGVRDRTYLTLATGGTFSKYSHEFQTLTSAGEDIIYICQKCDLAINKEIKDKTPECPDCGSKDFRQAKAIEVANIFKLGTRFSDAFELKFRDKNGQEKPVLMGCYGFGPARLIGVIVEIYHDEQGIIWPASIAPAQVHLLEIGDKGQIKKEAEKIYQSLEKQGIEVLYDDRDEPSAGEKFAEADLIGIPIRMVVSQKTLAKGCVEIKKRNEKKVELVKIDEIIKGRPF